MSVVVKTEPAVLSFDLGAGYFDGQTSQVTLALFDACAPAVTLRRLMDDGSSAQRFELSGDEVEKLIAAYRVHRRRLRAAMARELASPVALGDLADFPF